MSFIICEGIDGSGKTTQALNIAKQLNIPYKKFPDYKNFPMLDDFLHGRVHLNDKSSFLLFLSDIAQNCPEGDAVLDRYVLSTIAYATTIDMGKAMDIVSALDFREPSLILLFDANPEVALERKKDQKTPVSVREKLEIQGVVRERFLTMYKRQFLTKNWYFIDGNKPLEEVSQEVLEVIRSVS
ncbi:MAG: hypothetical protein D6797_00570 [Bdellovibrio sp.]|nr:MAG: hypothetical protein D6797_00570 [Bdellovibrio sp.]